MTPAEFERLQVLFEEGINLPAGERPAFLDTACQDEGEMRDALERMLKASSSESGFVTGAVVSALNAATGTVTEVKLGERLGGYRILRHLASGGMAHVYLAERADDEFQKKVAIKVIQAGLGCEGFEPRFRLERQILASLEHPNCCRLIDGGVTAQDRPYLVMEYVDGETITAYAANNGLHLHQKLALFRQLCSAVEYAHSNLVIHRDLKPGNVLVTADGIVKLMDFGIAKLMDTNAFGTRSNTAGELTTRLDQMATPGYASPEQNRGESISTATDIYSLGIILLEILTGDRLKPASTPALPREIEAIIHRATHPEAARRYQSAGMFSEDIGRYLDGYPVLAKPDSWAYRASKFVSRNRAAVVAGALAGAVLVAGLFSTMREQERTKRRFDEVRNLATVFLFEFDASIQDLPGSTEARRKLVQRALSTLQTLSRDSQRDQSLQLDLAQAFRKVASIQWKTGRPNLGDRNGAITSIQKEIAIREQVASASPENTINRVELANAYGNMTALFDRGNPKEALAYANKARRLLAELEKQFPYDTLVLASAAVDCSRNALTLHKSGQLKQALEGQRHAIALLESVMRRKPGALEDLRFLGWAHIYAGDVLGGGGAELHLGDRNGAIEEMNRGLEIFREIERRQPDSGVAARDTRATMMRIAGTEETMGNLAEGIQIRSRIIASVDAQYAADPASSESARDASLAHSSLGFTLSRANRLEEAERELRRAEAIARERMVRFPQDKLVSPDLASTEHSLAIVFRSRGKSSEAIQHLRNAVALRSESLKVNPEDSRLQWRQAKTFQALGEALEGERDYTRARAAFGEAIRIYSRLTQAGQLTADEKDVPNKLARKLYELKSK